MWKPLILALTLLAPFLSGCGSSRPDHVFGVGDAQVTVAVGDTFDIRLGAPVGVAPEYRYRWLDATAEGEAVHLEERTTQGPGKDVDGGSIQTVYRFEARERGEVTVEVSRDWDDGRSETEPYRLHILVKSP